MNILLLTYQGHVAGSTNSIIYLALGLADRGHRVYLGCRRESLFFERLQGTAVTLIPMTFGGKFDRQNMREIRDAVRTYAIDIVNAQSSKDRYTSIFARWFYGLPCKVVHTRRQRSESLGGRLKTWFYVRGTDRIVVISDELKRMFVQNGFPAGHIEVIYNGIPAERFADYNADRTAQLRVELGLGHDDVVIGCISRLKKQEQLVRALPFMDPSWKVLFVGIEREALREVIEEVQPVQELVFAGVVNMRDVINYYKLLDVNILASTMDGFGLVLVEAMGMDTPVVGTRAGGIMNVIAHEENGLLFDDGDVEGLAAGVRRMIEDEAFRGRCIAAGRKTAFERFSIERTIEGYERFFMGLLDDRR